MTTNQINKELDHLEQIRSRVIDPVKIQLHTGLEGFDSPETYSIHRKSGGPSLGTVGRTFEPPNLNRCIDFFAASVLEDGSFFDLSTLDYSEYYGGSKVSLDIMSKTFEVKSPLVGDIFQAKLHFFTGYDGKTKNFLNYSTERFFCENGAKGWNDDVMVSYKNTIGNVGKLELFTQELVQVRRNIANYKETLEKLAVRKITQTEIDTFMKKVFGYSQAEYKELATRTRHTLDRINRSVAIEEQVLGMTAYSLLQGITRYTTHEITESAEDTFFGTAKVINEKAHIAAIALLN